MSGAVHPALALARAGDIAGAIAAGEATLRSGSQDAPLALFVGMLCCRQGDPQRGLPHIRQAVALAPRETAAKVELARALIATDAFEEAEAVAAPLAGTTTALAREMQRIRAHAVARTGDAGLARQLYEELVAVDAGDFESWDGAGAARLATGDVAGAVTALQRATQLRPTAVGYWINLARAQYAAQDYVAALAAADAALARDPDDVAARLERARSLAALRRYDEAVEDLASVRPAAASSPELLVRIADASVAARAFAAAEADYRAVLAVRPDLIAAWVGLGKALERTNLSRELLALVEDAAAAGVPGTATALLRAQGLRAAGRLDEALAAVEAAPADIDPVDRAQLLGDIADRLGLADRAFAAFADANAQLAAGTRGSVDDARAYLERFERVRSALTPERYASWTPSPPPGPRRAPLFIFGFPRSGTTLIDTMLSGHPDALVLEEEGNIDAVGEALGPIERLASLSVAEIEALRDLYFSEVAKIAGDVGDRLIVDKNPLGLGSTPLLHRLFPDARFVFAERHPCDVVLSCFVTSSRMNAKIASFYDFEGTARLYDRVLAYWQRCREVLPIAVHTVRYETLIADPETELRRLAEFAGLEWDSRLLSNQTNAAARGYIGSPSYAQVAEPIYKRADGRWRRYRSQMAVVMPILGPWIDRLGYDAD